VPRVDPARVRQAARHILARPEFRTPSKPLLDRARDWVYHQVGRIISDLASGGAGSIIGIAIIVAAALATVIVIARYSRTLRADPARQLPALVTERRPARDWLADAVAYEQAGAWRNALRCRYRALVAELDSRGVIAEVPGTTAGEYRQAVARRAPVVGPPFEQASELFERAWYGDEPGGENEAGRFRRLADEVLASAGDR
jgi:hypothetical protein